mgnify:CR=1 FL=1
MLRLSVVVEEDADRQRCGEGIVRNTRKQIREKTTCSVPTISVSGGSGSGATVEAAFKKRSGGLAGLFGKRKTVTGIENGKIKNLFIINPGSGYTSAPTISISGGGGSGATAVA